MAWTLYVLNENVQPPVGPMEHSQHETKDTAVKEAWGLTCGPTRQPHLKPIRVEGPDGERKIEQPELEKLVEEFAKNQQRK